MQGLNIDMGQSQERERANTEQPKEVAPKQMTWASIASQPAKPQIRVSIVNAAVIRTKNTNSFVYFRRVPVHRF